MRQDKIIALDPSFQKIYSSIFRKNNQRDHLHDPYYLLVKRYVAQTPLMLILVKDWCHHHLNSLGFKVVRTKLSINKEFQVVSGLPPSKLAAPMIAARLGASIAMGAALLTAANTFGQIAYKESLIKETNDFVCELKFYSEKGMPGDSNNLSYRRNMPNTLDEISICIRHCE